MPCFFCKSMTMTTKKALPDELIESLAMTWPQRLILLLRACCLVLPLPHTHLKLRPLLRRGLELLVKTAHDLLDRVPVGLEDRQHLADGALSKDRSDKVIRFSVRLHRRQQVSHYSATARGKKKRAIVDGVRDPRSRHTEEPVTGHGAYSKERQNDCLSSLKLQGSPVLGFL